MDPHRKFLAERILNEEKPVTYRILSRAMKAHVNSAKEMLYDFHRWQNALRPGSIHATYLVYGSRKVQDDGDVEMTSSAPDAEPLSEDVPVQTMTLVEEAQLQDVLAQYEAVTAIHIYSLSSNPVKDLQLLSDVAGTGQDQQMEETPEDAKTYGAMSNPFMRQRQRKGKAKGPTVPQATGVKIEPGSSIFKPAAQKSTIADKVKQENTETQSKETPSSAPVAKKPTTVAPLKRANSGGIGQMFAKAAAKPKTIKKEVVKEEEKALSDDGEDDTDVLPPPKPAAEGESARQSRLEREAALRRMMEESDEEEPEKDDSPVEDEPMDDVPEPEPAPELVKEEPAEVVSSAGDGRRRGKRRVMKKKQVMDDQGYLVTIQEQAWESFSEDEAPAKPKPSSSSQQSASGSGAKPKKPTGKGQGNIMAFFAKK